LSLARGSTIEPDVKVSLRFFTVAIAILSWIAISNHCAVGAVTTKTEATESECPFHSKPAKQKEDSSNIQCCKVLRAVLAKISQSWARDDANFSDAGLSVALAIVLTESHNAAPLLLDTGPPGKTSFVELIGSMRAHAPPITASL
jgi:hypothetical protein